MHTSFCEGQESFCSMTLTLGGRVTEGDSTESKREQDCCCKGKGKEKRRGSLCVGMVGKVTWSTRDREDWVVPCECAMCWAIRNHSCDCASPFLIAYRLGFAVMELPLRKRFQFCSCTFNFVSTYPCFSCCPFKGHCIPLLSQSKPVLSSWSGFHAYDTVPLVTFFKCDLGYIVS